jgi:guanine deaminase
MGISGKVKRTADGEKSFVIKGDICFSKSSSQFEAIEGGFLVCVDGESKGAFPILPDEYAALPRIDHTGRIITPGLVDLHIHAPQFAFRGLGFDVELLEWLNVYAFPEETKYRDMDYARRAYSAFVDDMKRGPNTRAVIFATRHVPATILLMDMLEATGLVTIVGKINMDRNSPPGLMEESAERSSLDTEAWLDSVIGKYANTSPILTPRFIPSCSDDLMRNLKKIQERYKLPLQSHLSETKPEIEWVKQLCPWSKFYGDAYSQFGLFGLDTPTVMAHCAYSGEDEIRLMRENGVFVAHCPQSNTNLSSGIAPTRKFLGSGIKLGLGSDIAGGADTSIFRVMRSTIEMSKIRSVFSGSGDKPLSLAEVFYLGTAGGGSFFGKVGSFAPGNEFDAVVIDDANLTAPFKLTIEERVSRIIYFSDDRNIVAKYARGNPVRLTSNTQRKC